MSKPEQQLSEFEELLSSVAPTGPLGNAMQIMYLAGQQSKTRPTRNKIGNWKAATFISSTIAAGLLVFLVATTTPEELEPVSVASQSIDSPEGAAINKASPKTTGFPSMPMAQRRPSRPSTFEIAQSRLPKNSIEMFGDFELKPVENLRLNKEHLE